MGRAVRRERRDRRTGRAERNVLPAPRLTRTIGPGGAANVAFGGAVAPKSRKSALSAAKLDLGEWDAARGTLAAIPV